MDASPLPVLQMGFQVWAQGVTWDTLMDQARRIESAGFDSLWSNDHFLPLVGMDDEVNRTLTQPIFEGWMVLAGFAAATRRVRLGVLVSGAGYRNVGLLAKMATTVDHASHGRAVLGIGAGWFEREHRAFGLAFPSTPERLDRLAETAEALYALLRGESVSRSGTWVQLEGARIEPSIQRPLPLLIGGSGPRRTLPLVARWADVWNGEGTPTEVAERNARLDELCLQAGRSPASLERTVGVPPPVIRSTHAEAIDVAAEILVGHGMPPDVALVQAAASPVVGTTDRVTGVLVEYVRAGVDGVIFDWPAPFDDETRSALAGPVRAALTAESPGRRRPY